MLHQLSQSDSAEADIFLRGRCILRHLSLFHVAQQGCDFVRRILGSVQLFFVICDDFNHWLKDDTGGHFSMDLEGNLFKFVLKDMRGNPVASCNCILHLLVVVLFAGFAVQIPQTVALLNDQGVAFPYSFDVLVDDLLPLSANVGKLLDDVLSLNVATNNFTLVDHQHVGVVSFLSFFASKVHILIALLRSNDLVELRDFQELLHLLEDHAVDLLEKGRHNLGELCIDVPSNSLVLVSELEDVGDEEVETLT